jgi:sugar phosphate isomerase/epimerase
MAEFSRRSFLAAAAVAPATLAHAKPAEAKFKLGLVSYMVPANWDLKTALAICKQVGIAALEARTTHKHGIEPTLSAADRTAVKKQFADSGVVFWGSGSTCEFHSADKAVVAKNVEECKRFCQLVADLGGKGVKVRPNGVAKGMTVEQACTQIGKALIECGKAAESAGVEIWVEVHGAVTQEPKNMKAIMDACGHKAVGVTWNSNDGESVNGSIAKNFDLLAPHIKSCHINDLDKDAAGKYPYRELFKKLTGIGYDRYTLIEVNKAMDPDLGKVYLTAYKAKWEAMVKG